MEFASAMKQIITAFRRRANQTLEQNNLTVSQAEMLFFIARQDEKGQKIIQRNIEEALHLSNPTVSGTLDRLEKKRLIERRPDPENRRVNLVQLTDVARQQRDQTIANMIALEECALIGFTAEEILQLEGFLTRILKNIT